MPTFLILVLLVTVFIFSIAIKESVLLLNFGQFTWYNFAMKTRLLPGGTWFCGEIIMAEGLAGFQLSFNFTVRNFIDGGFIINNYRKSDYTANKFSQGIVYRFNGETIEVTLEDYLRENIGKTEQDFQKLKAVSGQIYYE